ncbi:MAG: aminoacyl-tRNA hydrolase [Deltaproteobacteria bacterium]|jgi:PTH1 family peptidyl-tRNA hydrolase|nr:aminoacyl-tRNA hydrolase [Deltaproteobacteria bacterium]
MVEKVLKMVVGLGNPGAKYQNTRHNAGFMAVAQYAQQKELDNPRTGGACLLTWGKAEGQKFLLAWPQSFMNNSGQAIRKVLDYYRVEPENLLVLHDEMDLPLGRLKATKGGGAAGHRGIESILEHIPNNFDRLRIGVGRPPKTGFETTNVDYVLSPFTSLETEILDKTLLWAADIIQIWLLKNLASAQMLANRSEPRPPKKPKTPIEPKAETADSSESLARAPVSDLSRPLANPVVIPLAIPVINPDKAVEGSPDSQPTEVLEPNSGSPSPQPAPSANV